MAVDVLCSEIVGLYETQVKSLLVPGIVLELILQAGRSDERYFKSYHPAIAGRVPPFLTR